MTQTAKPAKHARASLLGPSAKGRARRFFSFSLGFWRGDSKRRAWLLSLGVIVFLLANLGAALAVNRWHKYFFDALERKDLATIWFSVGLIIALAILSAGTSAGLLHMRMRLQIRWREWLASSLFARWLSERRFYQLSIVGGDAENPEARMSDDARLAVELLVDFSLGVLNAVLAAVSFIGVLWFIGGGLEIGGFYVPGYLVIACIIYSALTSGTMYLLGAASKKRLRERRNCATS